jgi:protein-disulfide isomerase
MARVSRREELRNRRRQQQQRQRLFLIGGVAIVAVILAAILIVPGIIANSQPLGDIANPTQSSHPQASGTSMGNPNAPVKVDIYSDFQCPYCKEFADTYEERLITDLVSSGKVYFTYIPFKVIGPESDTAAQASLCASDQNKFWEMHDILFANQGAENSGIFTDRRVKAMAQLVPGLDMNQFNSCMSSNKYSNQLAQDEVKGTQIGVNSTPSFVVNGKLLQNVQLADVENAIRAAVPAQ